MQNAYGLPGSLYCALCGRTLYMGVTAAEGLLFVKIQQNPIRIPEDSIPVPQLLLPVLLRKR